MKSRALVLVCLLVVLILVVVWRVTPNLPRIKQSLRDLRGPRPALAQPGPARDASLTTGPQLSDGSFNPVPARKAPLGQPPAQRAGQEWRERYRSLLDTVRPAADSPGFYVYPFLDQTPGGVGLTCTYGWRPVGTAALVTWTRARVTGFEEPARYGLPLESEATSATQQPAAATLSLDDWLKRALADQATRDARYVIGGLYHTTPGQQECRLTIGLADRTSSGPATVLYEAVTPQRGTFEQLAAQQREAARAMTRKLTELGLTQPRTKPQIGSLKLDDELQDVKQLLDGNDSWLVMDGIDRALQLAALFPGDTRPLQAAAYGLNVLNWALCFYGFDNVHGADLGLKAYGLAQVTLALDPKPALSRMNWAFACAPLGHDLHQHLCSFDGKVAGDEVPELAGYLNAIEQRHDIMPTARQTEQLPDWQVLNIESYQSWFVHSSPYRGYFNARTPHWPQQDFFLQAAIQNCRKIGYYNSQMDETLKSIGGNLNEFGLLAYSSTIATRVTLGAELASLLVARPGGGAGDPFITAMAQSLVMDETELASLAAGRDYYKIRDKFIAATASWDPPENFSHPAYAMLEKMAKKADEIYQSVDLIQAPAGYLGFEFTPAERVRLAQWRDSLGPMLLAELEGAKRAVYENLNEIGSAYLKARPDSISGLNDLAGFYDHFLDNLASRNQYEEALTAIYRAYPLDIQSIYKLARLNYYLRRQTAGERLLGEFERTEPFCPFNNRAIGELYQRYGYHAKAVDYLAKFIKDVPERYDVANEWAWSMCQLGRADDPRVRETYAKPPQILPGNSSFHEDYLNYLYYWTKDKKAVREAAEFYRQWNSFGALGWLAWLEKDDGNTTKALELLAQTHPQPEQSRGLALAIYHAQRCNTYIDYNRLDLAEQHLKQAMAIDDWQGNVIEAMANLAYAKGDYDTAIKEHQRGLERYGFNSDHLLGIANCYEKKGQTEEAIRLLEQEFEKPNQVDGTFYLAPRLLKFYVERKDEAKARRMMDEILKGGRHTRRIILDTVDDYRKIKPDEAAVIEQKLNDIMAVPMSLEQVLKGKPAGAAK